MQRAADLCRQAVQKVSKAKAKGQTTNRTYTSQYRGVHQTFPTKRWEAQFRSKFLTKICSNYSWQACNISICICLDLDSTRYGNMILSAWLWFICALQTEWKAHELGVLWRGRGSSPCLWQDDDMVRAAQLQHHEGGNHQLWNERIWKGHTTSKWSFTGQSLCLSPDITSGLLVKLIPPIIYKGRPCQRIVSTASWINILCKPLSKSRNFNPWPPGSPVSMFMRWLQPRWRIAYPHAAAGRFDPVTT